MGREGAGASFLSGPARCAKGVSGVYVCMCAVCLVSKEMLTWVVAGRDSRMGWGECWGKRGKEEGGNVV